ncbi:MAG: carbohydrate-binding family 9-like protein [Fimbriimonas sp.]
MSPRTYVCARASGPPQIDGRLDKPFWARAGWSEPFLDILGVEGPTPWFKTRMKMLWDDSFLYIGAELEEPHVWGSLTVRDSVIFNDNDFEIFIDPDGDNHLYGELEINALNTVWDLLLVRPYRDAGPIINGWDIAGLQHAVWVDGTLNDPSDTDRGWSLEVAIPWKALKELSGPMACPPKVGDQWRANFSRVQWEHEVVNGMYRRVAGKPEENWVWSPQGVVDMHRPEEWGILQFGQTAEDAVLPYVGLAERRELMRVYYAQKAFHSQHGRYASSIGELGMHSAAVVKSAGRFWSGVLGDWQVDHESRLVRLSQVRDVDRPSASQ